MFTADLVLDDVSGDPSTYRLRKNSVDGSERIDIATTLISPAFLNIKHTQSGSGDASTDRHLVQFIRTFRDTAGKAFTVTTNFTQAVQRTSAITSADCADEVNRLINLLNSVGNGTMASIANIESLLRGES